ncbi:hypothetical protein HaLaN_22692 [Haematococcus lacustris]|uniref:Uncharacterized protein n=1 Tax=Haematococcus lacustris TaxID=44745 RepID=A0A699ZYP6_HAELA|nr:hypothetical protein HaLaN_22692 [Haematococcus lacustris]
MHFNPSATPAFAATHMRAGMFLAMRQACKRAREYGVLHDPYALCHLIRAFVLPLGLKSRTPRGGGRPSSLTADGLSAAALEAGRMRRRYADVATAAETGRMRPSLGTEGADHFGKRATRVASAARQRSRVPSSLGYAAPPC